MVGRLDTVISSLLAGVLIVSQVWALSPSKAHAAFIDPVPDSSLEAIKGRNVSVTNVDGMSVEGELAAFDEKTVTVISEAGQLVTIQRTSIGSVKVVAAPNPEPSPEPAPTPAAATTQVVPAPVVTTEAAPAPAPQPVPNAGKEARLRQKGVTSIVVGAVSLGVLTPAFLGTGAWQLGIYRVKKSAYDACGSSCGSRPSNVLPVILLTFGGLFALLGIAGLAIGSSQIGQANRLKAQRPTATLTPVFGPNFGGLSLSGRF